MYRIINVLLIALSIYLIIGIIQIITESDMIDSIPPKSSANFQIRKVISLEIPEMPDTFILNGFETQNDLYNLRNIEKNLDVKFNYEWKTHGKSSAKAAFKANKYSELGLRHFPPWWNDYDSLSFDLYLKQGQIGSVTFRIGDYYSSEGYCSECQKFVKILDVNPGGNHYSFSIDEIRSKIDLNSDFKSIHLGWKTLSDGVLLIDNVRLTKNAEQ